MHDKHVIYAYERGYRVSDTGEVISPQGRVRALQKSKDGYLRFSVKNNGVDGTVLVHKLVALQNFGAFDDGLQVRHLNGQRDDNRKENIAIGTCSDNQFDKSEAARKAHARIAAFHRRRFTEEEIAAIRRDREAGMTLKQLVLKYGGVKSTMSDIINQKFYCS